MTAVPLRAAAVAVLAGACLLLSPQAQASPVPQPPSAGADVRAAARQAAVAPDTLATLARFFAREGRVGLAEAKPRIEGETIPVHHLSPDFVAGKAGAPVARLEFLASEAVSSDGQRAALWTARTPAGWQVVNIATGDDEFRYAGLGAERLPGGTVFREPQIDAWYVARGDRVLPLDEDATRAVGAAGTSLAGYRTRVAKAYGDKLPGSVYARDGRAGGYAEPAAATAARPTEPSPTPSPASPTVGAAGAAGALALGGAGILLLRRRTVRP
ncbi:hypothetical protein ACFWHQ_16660 [Streptomyces sp. NPDC060334]|uniref:hypothetical protein n=1 Tax=unclassified Streptomyces TaxID=2593676 RepID=UPI00331CF7FE